MFAGAMSGYGHAIVIQHNLNGQRVDTLYGHMFSDGVLAKVGDRVRGGQHIANVGNDGDSSGPHLHLSLHPGAYTGYSSGVDPMPWLSQDLPSAPSGRTDFLPGQLAPAGARRRSVPSVDDAGRWRAGAVARIQGHRERHAGQRGAGHAINVGEVPRRHHDRWPAPGRSGGAPGWGARST